VHRSRPDPGRARIEYVGHATVFLDLDGVRLLTDPLLRNRVAHLRRSAPVPARTRRGIDAVLISHAHYDHLDLPSLERLGKQLPVVVPRGLGGLLRKRRFESVIEVEEGEKLAIGELTITAVPAEHDGSRSPIGVSAKPLGFVVAGSKSVYFAGDTDLFDGMSELGPVDVGLIPIWGWGPTLGGGGHLDPVRAAEAAALVRPGRVIPIHWGTYFPIHLGLTKAPDFVAIPPLEFVAAMREAAPDIAVTVLKPGESVEL
jgi:L-ascorbate metabolism protein UlaG (beta-lactamase superfamily)